MFINCLLGGDSVLPAKCFPLYPTAMGSSARICHCLWNRHPQTLQVRHLLHYKRWVTLPDTCRTCSIVVILVTVLVKVTLKESDVTCGQVWLPILGICALHLTHPKCTHTAVNTHTPWTHTRSSGQPFMLWRPGSSWGFGALLKGTSVVVLRVERVLVIHSPHLQFLPDLRLELSYN